MAQLGTIKVQTQNNGTVSVPVYNPSDFGSSVYDMLRVQTAGGVGAIPLVAPADASHPYLRVQTQNNGVVAVHNEAALVTPTVDEGFEDGTLGIFERTFGSPGVTTNAIDGSYSLLTDADSSNEIQQVDTTFDQVLPSKFNFDFYSISRNGGYTAVELMGFGGTVFRFYHSSTTQYSNMITWDSTGDDIMQTYRVFDGNPYSLTTTIDLNNNELTWEVDGSSTTTQPFYFEDGAEVDNVEEIRVRTETGMDYKYDNFYLEKQ